MGIEKDLVELAWRRMWTPGSKYYLPDIMLNGINIPGYRVDPYRNLHVAQLGPMPLFQQPPFGAVTAELTKMVLSGLPGVFSNGIDYDENTRKLTAKIGFGPLELRGRYRAEAAGAVGCAVDVAKFLLGGRATVNPAETADDPQLAEARRYRDRLADSPAGRTLIGTYYDNNAIYDEICKGNNIFTANWATETTDGLGRDGQPVTVTSKDLANQTYDAALPGHENDPTRTLGYDAYARHSFLMQGYFIRAAQEAARKAPPERKEAFHRAINATFAFRDASKPHVKPQPVGNVMKIVESSSTDSLEEAAAAGAAVELPFQAEIDRRVEEGVARWEVEQAARQGRSVPAESPDAVIEGDFVDTVKGIGITFHATIKVTGTMPDLILTVTIDKIDADVPRIAVRLRSEHSSELFNAVQNYIANTPWVQSLLSLRAAAALDDRSFRDYLGARMNDALKKLFGAVDFDALALDDTETNPDLDAEDDDE